MNEQLTAEQVAGLWALDFDLCVNNVWGATNECSTVASYDQICVHCDYVKPLCQAHAAATVALSSSPDPTGPMPIWRCDRCRRCSDDFHAVFHLHITKSGTHHG